MQKIKHPFAINCYTLFFAIVGTIILIWDFLDYVFFHSFLSKYDLLYIDKAMIFVSFFTQQTNIMVIIYFYVVTFLNLVHKKNTENYFLMSLFITVYISVTSLVFIAGLLPGIVDKNTYDLKGWIFTVFLHFIIPISMINYYFWMAGRFHYDLWKFNRHSLYKIYIYPFIYFTFVMIRGELRHQNPNIDGFYKIFSIESFDLEYPYWFFNYHHYPYGVGTITVSLLFIFLLVTALGFFFLLLNNVIFDRHQNKRLKNRKK